MNYEGQVALGKTQRHPEVEKVVGFEDATGVRAQIRAFWSGTM